MKRKKAILCALASIGIMTSAGTVKANAMTMKNDTTTKCIYKLNADQVERLLYTLPYTINTTSLKGQFDDILKIAVSDMAYNSLDEEQQRRVDPYAVATLNSDKSLLKSLVKDEVKALGIACEVLKLEYQVNSGQTIDKQSVLKEINSVYSVYDNLDYAIRYSTGLSHFMNKLNTIQCKVASM